MHRLASFASALCLALQLPSTLAAAPLAITVQPVQHLAPDFMMGADLSMLDQLERQNARFENEDGKPGDAMAIVRDHGVNWVRLRLWHTPVNQVDVIEGGRVISRRGEPVGGGNNDLATTIRLAQRARKLGLKLLLDIHYSDFWCDPGKQSKPAAWETLHGAALEAAVHDYTAQVLATMRQAGVLPDMVQVGNELNGGMLWPDGKTWVEKPGEKIGGNEGFVALIRQGIRAVREAGGEQRIPVVVHLADGGKNELYRRVFDLFQQQGVDYDVIGLSYYPYYSGPVDDLQANMDDISARYAKPVAVVETAYAYNLVDQDGWPNLFNPDMQKTAGYRASVQGQASLVRDVIAAVAQVPGGRGLGVFYWEPAWVPAPGAGWRTGEGNAWENQAMFDASGRALPSLAVFKRVREAGTPADVPQPLQARPLALSAYVGQAWQPPEAVPLAFSDDATRTVYVQWDEVRAEQLRQPGSFQLKGRAGGPALAQPVSLVAEVQVVPRRNLVEDPGFEQGHLKEWTLSGDAAAVSNERNPGNAHSGLNSLHYWSSEAFHFDALRSFTGLRPGRYSLKAWSAGGGGERQLQIVARNCGPASEATAGLTNTGWQKWHSASLANIQVSEAGRCTVGLRVDAPAGTWGNVDDIEFMREDD